ncbi:hypothetical protein D9M73_100440 [compost metagenome]
MTTAIAKTAQATAPKSFRSIASANQEPIPGNAIVVLPTAIASEATTKNHPPDIDIMAFQTRPGMANGSSRRTNLRQDEKPNCLLTSSRSFGTVRSDW